MANWYNDQLTNRNYLSPIGFLFTLEKAKKASYLCQRASIPSISLGTVDIPTRGMVPIPTEGNVQYGTFEMEFIVDEDLRNYMELHNWIRALGAPQSIDDRVDWKNTAKMDDMSEYRYSDGTLLVLNNNNLSNFEVVFKNMFPTDMSTLAFDVTGSDNDYFTASVTFKYTIYEIRNVNSSVRR